MFKYTMTCISFFILVEIPASCQVPSVANAAPVTGTFVEDDTTTITCDAGYHFSTDVTSIDFKCSGTWQILCFVYIESKCLFKDSLMFLFIMNNIMNTYRIISAEGTWLKSDDDTPIAQHTCGKNLE